MATEKQVIQQTEPELKKPICGVVMPISAIGDCTVGHWEEVKTILFEAIADAGYEANLVSDADDSGVIQRRIVQNLYDNEIVVCDVSCKNPNVMFELGMRLAFDKPTIIVMDDCTNYSFDTGIIEHLTYPRDLSYFKILKFKGTLKDKIKGTIEKAKQPDYTPFLKNFGQFTVAKIESKEGSINDAILSKLDDMSQQIMFMRNKQPTFVRRHISDYDIDTIRNFIRQSIKEYYEKYKVDMTKELTDKDKAQLYNYIRSHAYLAEISYSLLEKLIEEQI